MSDDKNHIWTFGGPGAGIWVYVQKDGDGKYSPWSSGCGIGRTTSRGKAIDRAIEFAIERLKSRISEVESELGCLKSLLEKAEEL